MSSLFAGFAIDTLSYAHRHSLSDTIDLFSAAGCAAVQSVVASGLPVAVGDRRGGAGSIARDARRARNARGVGRICQAWRSTSPAPRLRCAAIRSICCGRTLRSPPIWGQSAIVMTPGRQHPLVPLPKATLCGALSSPRSTSWFRWVGPVA